MKKLLSICCLLFAAAASAESGFYAKAGVGFSNVHDEESKPFRAVDSFGEVYEASRGGVLFDASAGYQVNRWFAAEIGYLNSLGHGPLLDTYTEANNRQFYCDIDFSSLAGDGDAYKTAYIHGASLSGIGSYPVADKINLFGRLGAFIYDSKFSSCGGTNTGGVALQLGAGADYRLTDRFSLGGEYLYMSDGWDIGAFRLNLKYHF